jgi:hypothetical protein
VKARSSDKQEKYLVDRQEGDRSVVLFVIFCDQLAFERALRPLGRLAIR